MNDLAPMNLPCEPAAIDDFLSEPPQDVCSWARRVKGDYMVLGAGGKMGLHLSLMLKKALDRSGTNAKVTAVSRFCSLSDREQFEERGIATQSCDLCEISELEDLIPAENVFFLAGAKFGTADNSGLLKRMNVTMPEAVAEHFSRSQITAFSTGCVYSFVPISSNGSTEGSDTKPVGAYAQSCLGRELAFRRAALELGTRLTLVRLNYSVEFRYGVLVDIAQKVLRGDPVDVTMGHVNVIWQRDAIAHILLAHEFASTSPFVINVAGEEILSVRELAFRIGDCLGRKPVFAGHESETAWLNDASLAHRLFGVPEASPAQMIEWVSAWQKLGLKTWGKPTGFEKRDGNF